MNTAPSETLHDRLLRFHQDLYLALQSRVGMPLGVFRWLCVLAWMAPLAVHPFIFRPDLGTPYRVATVLLALTGSVLIGWRYLAYDIERQATGRLHELHALADRDREINRDFFKVIRLMAIPYILLTGVLTWVGDLVSSPYEVLMAVATVPGMLAWRYALEVRPPATVGDGDAP